MTTTTLFTDAILGLRKGKGMTQAAVAERMGIGGEYYGQIERGQVNPGQKTVARLAKAFELTAEEQAHLLKLARLADRTPPAPKPRLVSPPPEPFDDRLRFESFAVDAYEARLIATEMERGLPGNPFSRAIKATVPVEAVGPIRPRFPSLKLAAMFEEAYENRFGRRKAA